MFMKNNNITMKRQKIIKRIIFASSSLQKFKFNKWEKIAYIIIYNDNLYIIIYEQYFYIFSNLTFRERNNAKVILLIIFYVFSLLLLFFLYQTVILRNKKVYIDIYEHILYIIICLCMFIYIYTYSYMKNFLLVGLSALVDA